MEDVIIDDHTAMVKALHHHHHHFLFHRPKNVGLTIQIHQKVMAIALSYLRLSCPNVYVLMVRPWKHTTMNLRHQKSKPVRE